MTPTHKRCPQCLETWRIDLSGELGTVWYRDEEYCSPECRAEAILKKGV